MKELTLDDFIRESVRRSFEHGLAKWVGQKAHRILSITDRAALRVIINKYPN